MEMPFRPFQPVKLILSCSQVIMFVRHSEEDAPAVALLVTPSESAAVAEGLARVRLDVKPTWLLCSLLRRGPPPTAPPPSTASPAPGAPAWSRAFHGGIFVEPHMPELENFREYFVDSLQV